MRSVQSFSGLLFRPNSSCLCLGGEFHCRVVKLMFNVKFISLQRANMKSLLHQVVHYLLLNVGPRFS